MFSLIVDIKGSHDDLISFSVILNKFFIFQVCLVLLYLPLFSYKKRARACAIACGVWSTICGSQLSPSLFMWLLRSKPRVRLAAASCHDVYTFIFKVLVVCTRKESKNTK